MMERIMFPVNNQNLVVVPSNEEGTGFLNYCYDASILRNYMEEEEFDQIVRIASKIAAQCYSKQKVMDKKSLGKNVKVMFLLSSLMALTALFIMMSSMN